MHPLKQYLHEVKESIQDFGARVGASRQTLYRVIGGTQVPKPALARRIVEATGGAVSFDTLYLGRGADAAEVVNIGSNGDTPQLDEARIKMALAIVVNHLTPRDTPGPQEEDVDIATEAVVNTYTALSTVTTRLGPDRLYQALRPVLEEILRECSDTPIPPLALDRGAELAVQLYFQTIEFGRLQPPTG